MINENAVFLIRHKKYFFDLLKKYKWAIINGQIMSNIDVLIGVVLPMLFKLIIDYSFANKDLYSFFVLLLVAGILYGVKIFLFFLIDLNFVYVMHGFHVSIAKKVYKQIHRMKANEIEKMSAGELIYQTNVNSGLFWDTIFWSFFYLINPVVQLIITLIFVVFIDCKLAGIITMLLFVATILSNKITDTIKKEQKKLHDLSKEYDGFLYNTFDSIRDINILGCYKQFGTQIEKRLKHMHELKVKLACKEFHVESIISFVRLIYTLFIYIYLSVVSINGSLTIGEFVTLIAYWEVLKNSFSSINFYLINIKKRASGLDSVVELLEKSVEAEGEETYLLEANKQIEFENVSFGYEDGKNILENVNLRIKPNERIAIVGESGSGKSTIINLLTKQYKINSGHIRIFGNEIDEIGINAIRNAIGVVYQEPYIFEGTIRYNILLGKMSSTEEEIVKACKYANIWSFISSLPLGLDTYIGGEDDNLSWGQKQRICIARVFLKNPPILIFDEATSALDSEGEKIIKDAWGTLVKDRTVINISHRLTTIYDCDRIAVLEGGKIQEIGTHSELIINNKEYRKLFASNL